MKITELKGIDENAANKLKIANLPTRPNSTTLTGAKGLTANQLREKMDEYPDALREKLNDVIDSIVAAFVSAPNDKNVKETPIINDILLYDTNAEGDSDQPRLTLKMLATALLYCNLHDYTELTAKYLFDNTVGTTHLVDRAVTNQKIADEAVTFEKTKGLAGKMTADGGEIFNDYANNKAGKKAHVSGQRNTGTGESCQVSGADNTVTGATDLVGGRQNTVKGANALVCGQGNTIGEGVWSGSVDGQSNGVFAHAARAGGFDVKVYARHGFGHGWHLVLGDAKNPNEDIDIEKGRVAFGRYNDDSDKPLFAVGNGYEKKDTESGKVTNTIRQNAFAVYDDGHVYIHDDVYVHGGNDRLATADEIERGLETILDALNAALGEEVTA